MSRTPGFGPARAVRPPRRAPRRTSAPTPTSRRGPADPHGGAAVAVRCAVLTVSDTRGPREDQSGATAQRLIEAAGHRVTRRAWARDDRAAIRRAAVAAMRRRDVDVLLVTGGTGVAPRDVTPEALEPLFDRALLGFGERFRARSEAQVGSAAWLSRASAGVVGERLVVLLPGSPRAVELALSELLLPELSHLIRLLRP